MTKLKLILTGLMLLSLTFSYFAAKEVLSLRKENKRLTNNQSILVEAGNQERQHWKQLELTVSEMQQVIDNDLTLKTVLEDSLRVKAKRIKHLTHAISRAELNIHAPLRDTVVHVIDSTMKAPVMMEAQTFSWENPYYTARGIVMEKDIDMRIVSVDTIYYMTVNEKYSKWFLPKIFEKPTPVTKIWNMNPDQYIEVIKSINVNK